MVPRRGTICTLAIQEEGDDNVVIPYEVYVFLNRHNMKDTAGQWMELWMLRQQFPIKVEHAFFSALPGNVQTWPSMGQAMAHITKFRVDRNGK